MERLARVFNVCCKVKSLSKKIPYSTTQNLMTHLLLIVFWFRWRSFIFRFDGSFFILPQIIYFTLNNMHFLWYLILGPWVSFHVHEERQVKRKGNSFNIFSPVVDQIRSKKQNSKHALHWSCLLLNSTWLKPKI